MAGHRAPRSRCRPRPVLQASPFLALCLFLGLALTPSLLQPAGAISNICFDLISSLGAIYMQEHPARGKAVVAMQNGTILLMTMPAVGGRKPMARISVFLDISKRVWLSTEMGLHSFAFHPNFANNGRFFVTYTCDTRKTPDCLSLFGCYPLLGCTPPKVKNPVFPMTTIIAEYSAGPDPLRATTIAPVEKTRILGFSRPHTNHHGGHLFFGNDGYMYFSSGDGGSQGDPWALAQNIKSNFGKLLRFDVDNPAPPLNYSIPPSNPFQKPGQNPLVYALGLRNPWRCDQHPTAGTIACGDVGGSGVEEINIVTSAGNYGWRNYEGRNFRKNSGQRDPKKFIGTFTWPALNYTHASLGGLGCVIGGVFYTSRLNPCLVGKYLYSDHSGPIWVASLSGKPTAERITFKCARPSPVPCPTGGDGSDTEWGEYYSWSRDLSGNAYLLSSSGIFRVANQKRCANKC